MIVTVPIVLEYEAVLARQEHLDAAGVSLDDAGRFVDALCAFGESRQTTWLWRPQLRDPDDEMFLEAAVSASAAIVTFNLRDFSPAATFGVPLFTPALLWRSIHG